MNTQQNIAQTQEKFIINLAPSIARRVGGADRKILVRAYLKLFNGFSFVNWSNGHTLGRAWQTAFSQCDAFTKNRNPGNLAASYLASVFASHKKYWSRVIMTYRHSVRKIDQDGQDAHKIRARGMEMIRGAMDTINLILARYDERAKEVITEQSQSAPAPKSPAPAPAPKAAPAPKSPAPAPAPKSPAPKSPAKTTVPAAMPTKSPANTPAPAHSGVRPHAKPHEKPRVKPHANPNVKAEFNRGQQRVILCAMKLRIRVQNNIANFARNNTNSRAA